MNFTEHEIRKKYRYSSLCYVFDVYMECEFRANITSKEYEGLQPGEFRFDYKSWENRLGYSHKQMVRAIKELTTENIVIIQIEKGKKGVSSKYFLARFEEQKKEQNEEQNEEQNKPSKIPVSKDIEEQNREQNEEQKRIHSSQYNNLNIISNNIYSDFMKNVIKLYPGKKVKSVRDKKLPKILKQYSQEEIYRCINRYSNECKGKEIQYILNESTFWNGRYVDYLDSNYEESRQAKSKRKITNFDDE